MQTVGDEGGEVDATDASSPRMDNMTISATYGVGKAAALLKGNAGNLFSQPSNEP
jgi:hypothetical protein